MKYFKTTINKRFFTILLIIIGQQAFGQLNSLSPYSRFGIGELEPTSNIYSNNMGGASSAITPIFSVNFDNPASYSFLVNPTFQSSVKFSSIQIENAETTENNYLSSINSLALGFPLGKGIGMSFGLAPYSSVGYDLLERSPGLADESAATYQYQGDGGISKAYLGGSYGKFYRKEIIVRNEKGIEVDTVKHLSTNFSFGVNGDVLFGTINYNRNVIYDQIFDYYHRLESSSTSMSNLFFTAGAIYKKNLIAEYGVERGETVKKKELNLILGATYSPEHTIATQNTNLVQIGVYSSSAGEPIPIDTAYYSGDVSGSLTLPAKLTFGATFDFKNKKERSFMLSLEMKNQNWENFQNSLSDDQSNVFGNSTQLSIGFQFTPKPLDTPETPWYKKTIYQAGFRTGQNYLSINGEALQEMRASLGVSIPILGSRTLSRINLGMDFGNRGSVTNGLIKETTINSYIGLSLMPNMRKNGWFKKSKYQ